MPGQVWIAGLSLINSYLVAATADVADVEPRREFWVYRNSDIACHCSTWREFRGPRAATNTKPCAAQSQLKLRLRIAFTMDGQAVQDQVDFAGFPQGITSGSTV
jgi:hypothetical protein